MVPPPGHPTLTALPESQLIQSASGEFVFFKNKENADYYQHSCHIASPTDTLLY